MIRIEDVIEKLAKQRPNADLDLVRRAYFFSAMHHRGQTRASGEPYLIHPIEVADIIAGMNLDETAVATGLLHDVVEDTLVDLDTIKRYFGNDIAHLVDGLTKIASISNRSKEEQQAENVRKMVLAMITDVRVVLVKLADRLHNMRTLQFVKPEKRQRISQETLDIYAPIAHRLGMGKIRSELEDLSFQYLYPEDYKRLAQEVEARRNELETALTHIKAEIEKGLNESEIPFITVQGRVKRLYSIWRKLKKRKITIDEVFDLIAARIITTDEIRYCYGALGVVHQIWTPIPSRFRDWIAMPRDNMYQSLHTSVIGDNAQAFEIQIRTEQMHNVAEEGVAAHWKYKENKLGARNDDESWNRLRLLVEKQLQPFIEANEEAEDSQEFMESLKLDLNPKDVYAFTPKGKVLQLPRGATMIDFAYAIHSQVGHTCTGAKVSNRIVPLRSEVQNGEVIEILTNPNAHPSRDWLKYVATSRARNRIRHWIADQQRTEAIEKGRSLLKTESERFQIPLKKLLNNEEEIKKIGTDYGLSRGEDLFVSIGYGKILARSIIQKYLGTDKFAELDPEKKKATTLQTGMQAVKKFIGLGKDAIVVRGVDDLLTNRARCCNPIYGEPIVGYISLGKGITVHTKRCKNVPSLMLNKERIIEVEWAGQQKEKEAFAIKLLAITENRTGMIAGITGAISDIKTNIRGAQADVSKDDRGHIEITVEVFDVKHLDKIISAIKSVTGVLDVERINETA